MGKIYYKDVSYGGGGSSTLDGSIVGVEQIQKSGILIAVISVDEERKTIYLCMVIVKYTICINWSRTSIFMCRSTVC